jgi:hypothetical protein
MLLFVLQSDFACPGKLCAPCIFQQLLDRGIDIMSLSQNLFNGRARDQSSLRPRMPLAERLVI